MSYRDCLLNMSENMVLDRKDYLIMQFLQENGWLQTKELSARIGLSNSATAQRVKLLKEAGYIESAHAVVQRDIMGAHLEALFLMELDKHDEEIVEEFMREIVQLPEVLSAFLVTGRHDVVVNVVAQDMLHLKKLAFEQFTNRPFITRIETSMVYASRHSRVLQPLM